MIINNSNWGWFKYSEVFNIEKGIRLTTFDMEEGNIPYIASGSFDNGIVAYISNGITHKKGCISFACYGSIGECFYHDYDIWASDNVNIITLKDYEMNRYIGVFLISLFEKEKYRFSYGLTAKVSRLKNFKIKLPITKYNRPDWNFIESYIKTNLIPKLPSTAKSIWSNNYNNKPLLDTKFSFNTDNWKWFKIKDIFKLEKCKCSHASFLLEDGSDIAYIGAKKDDNGIMRYVELEDNLVSKGNCIVFIGDGQGSVGYCTYQPINFIGSTTLTAGYSEKLNKYNAQFLVTILDLERYRYSFGRKYGYKVVEKSKIKLPATSEGILDWEFMENYIKTLPYSKNLI